MDEIRTVVHTHVIIHDSSFYLAHDQSLDELKQRIEAAAATTGRFVDFLVVGNRSVSVLISPGTPVVFSMETMHLDERDTGIESEPFGGDFDL
jgi:hypothetical protein